MKKTFAMILLAVLPFLSNAQHVLLLKSGEKMSGRVVSLSDGVLNFSYKGSMMTFNVDELYSINFVEQKSMSGGESTSSAPREVGEKQVTAGSYLVRYKVADRMISRNPKIDNLTQKKRHGSGGNHHR